jgi:hypothetical protein
MLHVCNWQFQMRESSEMTGQIRLLQSSGRVLRIVVVMCEDTPECEIAETLGAGSKSEDEVSEVMTCKLGSFLLQA